MALGRALTLAGLGLRQDLAEILGFVYVDGLAGTGTTQGAAKAIGDHTLIKATTSASNDAFVLPADKGVGHVIFFTSTSATTAQVFPDSGSAINGGSADAAVNVTQNQSAIIWKLDSADWRALIV